MSLFRKFLSVILVFSLLCVPVRTRAFSEDSEDYVQRMIQYYLRHQEDAQAEIAVLLDHLEQMDPAYAGLWRRIMVGWAHSNGQMQCNAGILPDGLASDDSLCIVIMGYGLKPDGTMYEELVDRLVVGLSSALKYPNAYVLVTGGNTSNVSGTSEAARMAQWLMDRGLESHRIIRETRSYSTLQNVQRVYKILIRDYPQIRDVAVITSDYHIRQSCVLFGTMFHYGAYASGNREIRLVSNAVNTTGKRVNDLYTQAWGISAITGVPFDGTPDTQPELSE